MCCQNKSDKSKVIETPYKINDVEFVKNLSHNILTKQKSGGFYRLNEDIASLEMISGLNETVQKSAYRQIVMAFGDYKDLNFHSIEKIKRTEIYTIYRFKGVFESSKDVEIRAVLNSRGKLAGFFVKPWKDTL